MKFRPNEIPMSANQSSHWPSYSEVEVSLVSNVLRSGKVNYWTGTIGKQFEAEFAAATDSLHAIALANGTLALDLAMHGLKIGERNGGAASDEVIVTPRTFIASCSAIVNAGAMPIFADVDLDSQNITPETVAPLINENTKSIICVHLAGWPCDMEGFKKIAQPNGISLIEDCAQAHGATINGMSVGSIGDIGAWSFCQDKIMTTGGEGGMVTTNSTELWERMWSFKDHGKDFNTVHKKDHPSGFRWLHANVGTNYRLTEMQAAIGKHQLTLLKEWIEARNSNARQLTQALSNFRSIRLPRVPNNIQHAFYKFYAYVDEKHLANDWNRDRIVEELNAAGTPCFQGICPEVYKELAFAQAGMAPTERLPNAKKLGETSLMFPVHPTLTKNEMSHYIDSIIRVVGRATKS